MHWNPWNRWNIVGILTLALVLFVLKVNTVSAHAGPAHADGIGVATLVQAGGIVLLLSAVYLGVRRVSQLRDTWAPQSGVLEAHPDADPRWFRANRGSDVGVPNTTVRRSAYRCAHSPRSGRRPTVSVPEGTLQESVRRSSQRLPPELLVQPWS
jgi:hypothetical protein